MVKAVNKLILEINNTENEYFERAVFYIRPEMAARGNLREKAREYLSEVAGDFGIKKQKKRIIPTVLTIIITAVLSAGAGVLIIVLL